MHIENFSKLIRTIVFLIIGGWLFAGAQSVLTPTWNYPTFLDSPENTLRAFYDQPDDTDEVLFLGTSHSALGISPMQIYEETGIISYNLSTSVQSLALSYHVLNEALVSQHPKLVVLDVSSFLNYWENDPSWRYLIDVMPPSLQKLDMLEDYQAVSMNRGAGA